MCYMKGLRLENGEKVGKILVSELAEKFCPCCSILIQNFDAIFGSKIDEYVFYIAFTKYFPKIVSFA